MNLDFQSRVIIVSGGTGALGQSVVRQLLDRGAQVIVTYTKKEELNVLLAKLEPNQQENLTPFQADAANPKAVRELVGHVINEFHRIDGLANLIGGFRYQPLADMSWDDWNATLSLNLHTAFLLTQSVLPTMITANYGRIVSIGARTAIQAGANSAAYNVAKVGVMWLMETVSNEAKMHNVTANSVLPSIIDTPANRHTYPDADYSNWVRPDEIAELICYLLSDLASGTSGAKIPVYGKA